ncbi:Abortive infection protein [Stanieria cyanosphaera PCC 7437]|uniref:Abortive infection protein n=1 Tax=Stanieria cyanosphaera (strain ATCC 29371 / PCC 7437) TaxID=111780 RepID=K9XNW4_STAC7|nr:CPBP family glutamic-type intramembrane protease [Stanieria cyanosphaera]AFZ34218.1 Abortive infection protein [Stanieria cyanosphaera PCC 7437]
MTIKRLILAFLTILALARVVFSLGDSLSQPQIQSRLELYQSNLVLHVSEFKAELLDESIPPNANLTKTIDSLIGESPYSAAEKQYQKAKEEAEVSLKNFQEQLAKLLVQETQPNPEDSSVTLKNQTVASLDLRKQQLQQNSAKIESFIDELALKIGILKAVQNEQKQALSIWDNLIARKDNENSPYSETAKVLRNLWDQYTHVLPNAETFITSNLDSWFRYKALEKLYQIEDFQEELAQLQQQEQQQASQAIFKLALISGIPVLGGLGGIILLIFLLIQLGLKQEKSILATNSKIGWETPWNWEITWQVLIVGFFFIGQFVLPILLGLSGISPANGSLRFKALYVFVSYVLMALSGIGVLYLSIKSFLPLSKDWFKFKLFSNWFVWGFGGYLIALPSVLLVSLINQQIWHGQGGSNPLLFLALQAQDRVALAIFFITASIAAPLFEEVMFRGFLLPSLTRYVPVWGAIIISGFIFAVAHLSLSEVLPLATLGIILGIVYTRSRNLLAPIFLHSLWNSGTLLSLFVLGSGI